MKRHTIKWKGEDVSLTKMVKRKIRYTFSSLNRKKSGMQGLVNEKIDWLRKNILKNHLNSS